ncbi:hypothetical protein JYU34_021226 [Plutella xylostella]|uniref:Uncharacterized protein n=1 Tax=Plutella xylostella TaxID=51655 RepID=A0ABQ7PT41_PLUXY|nr:hypothetical protein JYU34_021226 [Plutella xylostella]
MERSRTEHRRNTQHPTRHQTTSKSWWLLVPRLKKSQYKKQIHILANHTRCYRAHRSIFGHQPVGSQLEMQSGSGHPPLERDVSLGETNVTRGGHTGRHSLLRSPTGVPSSRCAGQKGYIWITEHHNFLHIP